MLGPDKTLPRDEAEAIVARVFETAGASEQSAASTARALVAAEIDGQKGHGFSRVASYAAQLRSGKIAGTHVPTTEIRGARIDIDAGCSLAFPAIDLALDIVARFAAAPMPQSFFDGWMQVAFEEAKHFNLVRERLRALEADYGDMPAHDGLWQAAHDTRNDLTARLAVVPLILEARGLDVTPSLRAKMREAGDEETAKVLDIIYEDEKKHVAIGAKWFRFLCAREGKDPAAAFRQLVRANFRGGLKPPFNDLARAAAGLTPTFYRELSSQNMS